MFVITLKFGSNKDQAGQFMQAHNEWIKQGFDADIFLLVGGLQPDLGGAIMAHNCSFDEIQNHVNEDPFVKEKIVIAEILEISPAKTDQRLDFLMS